MAIDTPLVLGASSAGLSTKSGYELCFSQSLRVCPKWL
jgi:hypothetical protein